MFVCRIKEPRKTSSRQQYPDIPNLGDMTEYEAWSDDLLITKSTCCRWCFADLSMENHQQSLFGKTSLDSAQKITQCFLAGILGCDEAIETEEGKWSKAGVLCSSEFVIESSMPNTLEWLNVGGLPYLKKLSCHPNTISPRTTTPHGRKRYRNLCWLKTYK